MKKLLPFLLLALAGFLFAIPDAVVAPLPDPLSDNAVASLKVHGQIVLFSFMGIGPKKTWDAVSTGSYAMDTGSGSWSAVHPVPGTTGRIAAVAAGARDRVFLLGGYVLYSKGGGTAVPDVGMYDPPKDRWVRAADIPVAVGDSVAGVYDDRYIYLVGGQSNHGVVGNVQLYDAEKDKWVQATPIPTPVFGHAGSLVGDTIIYVDGVRENPSGSGPKLVNSDECWMGKISHHDPRKIEWRKLPAHPGTARYRIAAGGFEKDQVIYFSGGSDNRYDLNGIGPDGRPSQPSPMTFAFDVRSGKWEVINPNTPNPTMDHRGLLVTYESLVVVGGMDKDQKVTGHVTVLSKQPKAK